MKKIMKKIMILLMFYLCVCQVANAKINNIYTEDNKLIIEGNIEDAEADTSVTMQLLYPDKILSDLTVPEDYLDTVAFSKQVQTDENGDYSFKCNLKGKYGVYTAIVGNSFNDEVYTQSVNYFAEAKELSQNITLENLGNIYYDYKNIPLEININGCTNDKTKCLVCIKVTDASGSVIYKREIDKIMEEDGKVLLKEAIDLTDSLIHYGIFNLTVTTTDTKCLKTVESKTRFSVVHAPVNGEINEEMGMCNHFTFHKQGLDNAYEKLMLQQKIGMGISRDEVRWHMYEKTDGEYQMPTEAITYLNALSETKIDSFTILGYSNSNIISESPPVSEDALLRFGLYCYNLALELGDSCNMYEVWNEYNIPGFNRDGASPSDYANMLKVAYENVKKANPNAVVYGMSAANVKADNGYEYDSLEWMRLVLENGGGKYIDGLSFHPYTPSVTPEDADVAGLIKSIKALLAEYNLENIPVIASEYGWSSTSNHTTEYMTTQERQAALTVRAAALTKNYLDKTIWYVSQDIQSGNEFEDNLGFVKSWSDVEIPYEAKEVYLAIANYNALLSDSELKEEKLDGTIYCYKFETKDGRMVYMLWCDNESSIKYKLNIENTSVRYYDIYGNNEVLRSASGEYILTVSAKPIYIEETNPLKIYATNNKGVLTDSLAEPYNGSILNVTVKVDPASFTYKNGVLYIAVYDENGYLLRVEGTDFVLKDDIIYEITETIDVTDAEVVKAFVWKEKGNPLPVGEALVLKK